MVKMFENTWGKELAMAGGSETSLCDIHGAQLLHTLPLHAERAL